MIIIKKEYSYGILAIVAIVAIIAIFNLSFKTSVVPTSSEESESLVGESFKGTKILKQTTMKCDSSKFIPKLFDILSKNPNAKNIINLAKLTNCMKIIGTATESDLQQLIKMFGANS